MDKTKAFARAPVDGVLIGQDGMDIRDVFALGIMAGIYASKELVQLSVSEKAEFAYLQADAMMIMRLRETA